MVFPESSRGSATCSIVLAKGAAICWIVLTTCHVKRFPETLIDSATRAPQDISRELPWVCNRLDRSHHLLYKKTSRDLRWVCHSLDCPRNVQYKQIPRDFSSIPPQELPVFQRAPLSQSLAQSFSPLAIQRISTTTLA